MSKPDPKHLFLPTIAILALGITLHLIGKDPEEPTRNTGFTPAAESIPTAPPSELDASLVQSPEPEVRHPEGQPTELELEIPPPAAARGFQLVSSVLHVPLSYACLTPEDSPENPIQLGADGRFESSDGILAATTCLRNASNSETLIFNQRLKALPEGRLQLSNLCTLLLDSPAGFLPELQSTHAAFLTKSGRLKPAKIASIEEVATGWILRLNEPEDFCEGEIIDRVLLIVDPPIKDHIRVATWLLSELRMSKAVKLNPMETHTLPLTWKGVRQMGDLAQSRDFGAVVFGGDCKVPGFQSPAAFDWLAAPPTRSVPWQEHSRTYHWVPHCATRCSVFLSQGSVGQAFLPRTKNWKYGVEAFPLLGATEADPEQQEIRESLTSIAAFNVDQRDDWDFAGVSWIWGGQGELIHGSSQVHEDFVARAPVKTTLESLHSKGEGAALLCVYSEGEGLASTWQNLAPKHGRNDSAKLTGPQTANHFRIVNQTNWTGGGTLILVSLDKQGISLRPIPFAWPQHSTKWFEARPEEIAWFVTSPTAKGSFGLLGPEVEPTSDPRSTKRVKGYDIQLNLTAGWSSLLIGEVERAQNPLQEKLTVRVIGDTEPGNDLRALTSIFPAGAVSVKTSMIIAPATSELGPWGLKLLSADASPVYLDLCFPNSGLRRVQPDADTYAILVKLSSRLLGE